MGDRSCIELKKNKTIGKNMAENAEKETHHTNKIIRKVSNKTSVFCTTPLHTLTLSTFAFLGLL